MTDQFRFLFLTILILLLCSPTYAAQDSFSSNPAIAILDGVYDGTLGSMTSDAIDSSGIIPAGSTINDVIIDLSIITHTWIGDLVIKLESPNGTVLTLMSRPGLSESADDGNECCGDSSNLDGAAITFSDAGVTDAEDMGSTIDGTLSVCTDDGFCSYFSNPGAGPGTAFSDFAGEDPAGIWTLYVGDSQSIDAGTFNSWTLNIDYDAPIAPVAIPTLSEWGMIIMSLMMAGSAFWMMRRRVS